MLDREKVGRVISEQRKMKGMTQFSSPYFKS